VYHYVKKKNQVEKPLQPTRQHPTSLASLEKGMHDIKWTLHGLALALNFSRDLVRKFPCLQ